MKSSTLRYLKEDISVNIQTATKGQLITVSIDAGQIIHVSSEYLTDSTGEHWHECYVYILGPGPFAIIPARSHQIDWIREARELSR